jgi:hypothetical protein
MAETLVFSSTWGPLLGTNDFEIYSVMVDGSNLARLTNNSVYDGFSVSENSSTLPVE